MSKESLRSVGSISETNEQDLIALPKSAQVVLKDQDSKIKNEHFLVGNEHGAVTRQIGTVKRRYVVARRATLRSVQDAESL